MQGKIPKLFRLHRAARTMLFKHTGRSDIRRWSNEANLLDSWDTRTRILASFVPPGSTVLEFGAGRMTLPDYLPEGCLYTPSDIVDRGRNTLVCDLNAPQLPSFPLHDVAVFSGVLEYVHDLQRLIAHLAKYCSSIAASYAPTDFTNQNQPLNRRKHGWVNDCSVQELQNVFSKQGFQCVRTVVWESQQVLFEFVNTTGPDPGKPGR